MTDVPLTWLQRYPEQDPEGIFCNEEHHSGFVCTRPDGHDTFHVAHGNGPLVGWYDGPLADLDDVLMDEGL